MLDQDRYIDKPPVIEVIGWIAIIALMLWVMFYGFAYLCMAVAYIVGKSL